MANSGEQDIASRLSEQDIQRQEQMQEYLCTEILNQGYDGDQFGDYLEKHYPGAASDLTSISFKELKSITSAFKSQYWQNNYQSIPNALSSESESIQSNNNENGRSSTTNNSNISGSVRNTTTENVLTTSQYNTQFDQSQKRDLGKMALFSKGANQFALNKSLVTQPVGSISRSQAPSIQNSNLPKSSNDPNQSILNSTYSQSKVIKDTQGQTIVRKEVSIVPETSVVKDSFIKKNLEGEECSKVISCKKMEPSKIYEFLKQQEDAIQLQSFLSTKLNQLSSEYQQQQQNNEQQGEQENYNSEIEKQEPLPSKRQKNIKIVAKVEKYTVVEEGLFSSDYAVYEIKTLGLEWCVTRRYSDFEWLFNILKKNYPGRFIPPIPKKKAMKEMTNSHLYQRMRIFEQFLNEILASPVLSLTQEISEFLSISDQKAFEAKRKELDSIVFPGIVDEIRTPTGELISEVTPPLRDFWFQFSEMNNRSLINLQQINESMEQFFIALNKAGEHANQIASAFTKLLKNHEQFNKLSTIGKQPKMEQLCSLFNNLFMEISTFQFGMAQAIEQNMYEHTRYHQQIIEEFNSVQQFRSNLETDYLEKLKRLTQKKEKLFLNPNTSKWEIESTCEITIGELQQNKIEAFKYMLPTETKQLQSLGEYFGFANKSLFNDIILHLDLYKDKSCSRAITFTQDMALEINKLHIRIADSNIMFSDMLGKKESSLNTRNRPDI